jgi:TatD DNase family protein
MLEILRDRRDSLARGGVVHCFSGTYRDAAAYLDLGLMLSFTCIAGYPSADTAREVIRKVPAEVLMAETDAPYLPPADRRGTRNEPAHVGQVVRVVSEVRGIPLFRAADTVYANSLSFFGIAQ